MEPANETNKAVGILTILVKLLLAHLQLQPAPVDDLVGEDSAEEDFGEGAY